MGRIAQTAKESGAQKPISGTLVVFLNSEVSRERSRLLSQIEEERVKHSDRLVGGGKNIPSAKIQKLQKELEVIEEREREHAHELYFRKLPGLEFANLGDEHPPRPDSPSDLQFGYNVRETTLAAAKRNGMLLVPDEAGDITLDYKPGQTFRGEPLDEDDWQVIEETGSGWDFANLENLILNLNVYFSQQMVGRLKKG